MGKILGRERSTEWEGEWGKREKESRRRKKRKRLGERNWIVEGLFITDIIWKISYLPYKLKLSGLGKNIFSFKINDTPYPPTFNLYSNKINVNIYVNKYFSFVISLFTHLRCKDKIVSGWWLFKHLIWNGLKIFPEIGTWSRNFSVISTTVKERISKRWKKFPFNVSFRQEFSFINQFTQTSILILVTFQPLYHPTKISKYV